VTEAYLWASWLLDFWQRALAIDWWRVSERGSWLAVILATVFGLIQLNLLRKDQKRIAKDLARRPKLELGFFPVESIGNANKPSPRVTIKPTWKTGQEVSDPVTITFACCNNGDRTARELLYNISVQEGFKMTSHSGSVGRVVRSPMTGLNMWVYDQPYIHPQDISSFDGPFEILRGRSQVQFRLEVSSDYGSQGSDLTILIE
jgi:hypothetical protein